MKQLCLEPRFDPVFKLRNRIRSIDAALKIQTKETIDARLRLAMCRARLVQRVKELQ